MPQLTLEQQVAALEQQVAELRAQLANESSGKDWRKTIGMFKDDETYARIVEEGRKWRESERRKAADDAMIFRDASDEWHQSEYNIVSVKNRGAIEAALASGPIIVEHWFYRGSRAPTRLFIEDIDSLGEYLAEHAMPGDAFHVWEFAAICKDDNTVADGKYPDEEGLTPRYGAY